MPISKKYLNSLEVSGTYTGNGTGQTIEIGRRPKIVKITTADGKLEIKKHDGHDCVGHGQVAGGQTGISMRSFKIGGGNGITITDTTFEVDDNPNLNSVGVEYLWEVR